MDTLDNTDWDVVISGTGIKQSLLALSLSRSGLRILHIDANSYYGGQEAALSLKEVDDWVQHHAGSSGVFTDAVIAKHGELGPSRAYSLALAPQLIFAKSNLLSALVSSHVHSQLEFQAVGSWFVKEDGLVKVPGGREDIFQDTRLDLKTKRALMKFIRSINVEELELDETTMPAYLERFGIPTTAHAPILALTLSSVAAGQTESRTAVPNIVRHLQSIGHFGPGFGSLTPKYGGLAEIAQVACRACAVGGGVYVLGRDFEIVEQAESITLKLGEDSVKTKWLVSESERISTVWSKGIYIVNSPLSELFQPTSEGGVTPAGAVLMVPGDPPVYILAHSADTGECPSGQYTRNHLTHVDHADRVGVLYAAIQQPRASGRLRDAVNAYPVAWSLHYQQSVTLVEPMRENHIKVGNSPGLAVEDTVLDEVRQAWQRITGLTDDEFMKFEARTDEEDDQ